MTTFTTQAAADAHTERLALQIAQHLRESYPALVETPFHNGTKAAYGGGYCFTATLNGEDYHFEIVGPYVEGDDDE